MDYLSNLFKALCIRCTSIEIVSLIRDGNYQLLQKTGNVDIQLPNYTKLQKGKLSTGVEFDRHFKISGR